MRALALSTVLATAPFALSAATLDLFTSGAFVASTAGRAVQGVGSDALTWGEACRTCTGRSGYAFRGYQGSMSAADDSVRIGDFEHTNAAIRAGSGITGARLSLSFTGRLAGQPFDYSDALDVSHLESPNAPCAGGCADTVGLGGFDPWSFSAEDGEGTWTLTLKGFEEPGEAAENGSQVVGLYAALSFEAFVVGEVPETPAPVPLPPSGVLLLVAMGSLGALWRRGT
jgi:hypothetical protein